MSVTVLHGDMLAILPTLDANSFHSVVTDPPYHLTAGKNGGSGLASVNPNSPAGRSMIGTGFMGKAWDGGDVAFRPETWAAVLRVLKPGGHMVCFGGTRTQHRMVCAVEDAGFEIRDTLCWLYGTGFPKSHDVSKAIDKEADGGEKEFRRAAVKVVLAAGMKLPGRSIDDWTKEDHAPGNKWWAEFCAWLPSLAEPDRVRIRREVIGIGISGKNALMGGLLGLFDRGKYDITAPATPEAAQWQGWGSALKPAHEPILLCRKPLSEKSIAANVLKHSVGGINIDESRVPGIKPVMEIIGSHKGGANPSASPSTGASSTGNTTTEGRFPANVLWTVPEDEYLLRSDVTTEQKQELFRWLHENA